MRYIVFIAVGVGLYWGLKLMFGKFDETFLDKPNKVFFNITSLLTIGLIFSSPYWGTEVPGTFFERYEYKGNFYVYLFPGKQRVRSQRVPAWIIASGDINSSYRYTITSISYPKYKLTYFDNVYTYVRLGRIVTIKDNSGRSWGVELTDEPVNE